jgi:hypothetical protein
LIDCYRVRSSIGISDRYKRAQTNSDRYASGIAVRRGAGREMTENPQPFSPTFDRAARDAARKASLTEDDDLDMYGPPPEDDK